MSIIVMFYSKQVPNLTVPLCVNVLKDRFYLPHLYVWAVLLQSFHSWLKPNHPSIIPHYWGNYPGSTWVTCWINLSHTLHTSQCVVSVWLVNHTDHYSTPRGQGLWSERLSNQHPVNHPAPTGRARLKYLYLATVLHQTTPKTE